MIKECELVANTEVPKFDVHEWRKQRDVDMFGQVMLGLLPHVIAQVHTPYPPLPTPTYPCPPPARVEEAEGFGHVWSGDARAAASCHCSGTHSLPHTH